MKVSGRGWALLTLGWGLSLGLLACQPPGQNKDGSPNFSAEERRLIYSLSPLGAPPPDPSNRHADDPAAAHLGQFLFYDTRLSLKQNLSCASCHNPALGWGDGKKLAVGLKTGTRHSPNLWNVAQRRWFFWDGRTDSLWAQAIQPLESSAEMGLSRVELYRRFQQQADLKRGYEAVFGPLPAVKGPLPKAARPSADAQDPLNLAWQTMSLADRRSVTQFTTDLTKSLEAFERRIRSGEAPFDRFARGLRKHDPELQKALSVDAQKGLRLFIGRGQCILCHTGPDFSDGEFHNLGLPALNPEQKPDLGRFTGISAVLADPLNALGPYSDLKDPQDPYVDKLHYLQAPQASNRGEFKTPSLREITQTAPYMHDGRFANLEAVLAFYSALAPQPAVGRREDTIQPLNLSADEVRQLVAFLQSLNSGSPSAELSQKPASPLGSAAHS